jgi:hypothetical protein
MIIIITTMKGHGKRVSILFDIGGQLYRPLHRQLQAVALSTVDAYQKYIGRLLAGNRR